MKTPQLRTSYWDDPAPNDQNSWGKERDQIAQLWAAFAGKSPLWRPYIAIYIYILYYIHVLWHMFVLNVILKCMHINIYFCIWQASSTFSALRPRPSRPDDWAWHWHHVGCPVTSSDRWWDGPWCFMMWKNEASYDLGFTNVPWFWPVSIYDHIISHMCIYIDHIYRSYI